MVVARVNPFENLAPYRVGFCFFSRSFRGLVERSSAQAVFAHGENARFVERCDRLAGGGHDSANLVDFVAEKVEAYGKTRIAWKNVDNAAAHAKRAGAFDDVASIFEATRDERSLNFLECEHFARGGIDGFCITIENDGGENTFFMGRQCANERSSACDDDFFLAALKGPAGCRSARDLTRVGTLRRKGVIAPRGKMQYGFVAYVRRE